MSYKLDINAAIDGLCYLTKTILEITTKIVEPGMESRFNADHLPFAALEFDPAPVMRGGSTLKDWRLELPFGVTYCVKEVPSTRVMDTAREKCCNLAEELLKAPNCYLPYNAVNTASDIVDVRLDFSIGNPLIMWARERELPITGVTVNGRIIILEHG